MRGTYVHVVLWRAAVEQLVADDQRVAREGRRPVAPVGERHRDGDAASRDVLRARDDDETEAGQRIATEAEST
eukprot:7386130-Prymnesium_polylepis.1